MAGGGDEDDVADEALFMQESLELHYNVAELIGEWVSWWGRKGGREGVTWWVNDSVTQWVIEFDSEKLEQAS